MFGHLHVHTEHSKLDGMPRVSELLARAKEFGMTYMAVTDHGSCSGLYELDTEAEKYGIKPLLGCEFYLDIGEEKLNHILLLAKDETGLENMFVLHEYSYVHGFYKKPTINMEILRKHSEGLICCSACLANIIPRMLSKNNYGLAHEWANKFYEVFGKDFYLEVQSNNIPEQKIANKGIVTLAKDMGIKYVATNDVHYELKSDAEAHDVMLCMQIQKKVNDPNRWRFATNDFYFKTREEMFKDLHGLTEEERNIALDTCQEIADKCNARIKRGSYLPKFYATPKDKTEEQYLREMVTQRYKTEIIDKGIHTQKYAEEVREELKVIEQTGYAGYHLIVQDFVNYARNNGITVGDGRGSGAGCKVANILGITRIEPTQYNLLFERFLSIGREPDYDIDFADNNRIFSYLQEKYGVNNVARIVAFGTLAPKAVTQKVLTAFDFPKDEIARIKGCIPNTPKITFEGAYKQNPELLKYKKKYPKEFAIIERLEGRISHLSQHAGGVVIYPDLGKLVPLLSDSEDRSKRIIAWDKYAVEAVGLCKIDCLGLAVLETISNCLKTIKQFTNENINIYDINLEDEAIYKDLCEGKVNGVFQIEEQAQLILKTQPKRFVDLIAINALVRPGVGDIQEYVARREGKDYKLNPLRKSYMEETCGLYVYQEQFEQDCKTFAGWTIAYADKHVRKNKHIEDDIELRNKFIKDSTARGFDKQEMEELWQEIVNAVKDGYTFNKSHATAYAIILYRTAWLKHYYKKYWYASQMNKNFDDSDKLLELIAECKKENVPLLPPDLNRSTNKFIPTEKGILYALSSVKGLGSTALEHLVMLRPINSLNDLFMRATRKTLRINNIANLIKAGCFDFENKSRYELLKQLNELADSKKEYEERNNMDYEYEALGVYLQRHPMEKYSFKKLSEYDDNTFCLCAGVILETAEILDKRGNKMAFITINNQYGNIKCLAFASFWEKVKDKSDFDKGNIIMFRGRRSGNDCLINSHEVLERKC